MDRYEIQTKVSGKWIEHGIVEGDEAAARRAWLYVSGTLAAASRLITHDDKGRVIVVAKRAAHSGYRVTYGETLPVWSRVLPTLGNYVCGIRGSQSYKGDDRPADEDITTGMIKAGVEELRLSDLSSDAYSAIVFDIYIAMRRAAKLKG